MHHRTCLHGAQAPWQADLWKVTLSSEIRVLNVRVLAECDQADSPSGRKSCAPRSSPCMYQRPRCMTVPAATMYMR